MHILIPCRRQVGGGVALFIKYICTLLQVIACYRSFMLLFIAFILTFVCAEVEYLMIDIYTDISCLDAIIV